VQQGLVGDEGIFGYRVMEWLSIRAEAPMVGSSLLRRTSGGGG